jgi:uncharacterized membrane protein YdjX (TVP38/TMEM64 family)
MRIAVLILSLMTCLFLFLQSAIVGGLSEEGSNEESAGAFGVLMSLLMLVSAAVVIPIPRVAMALLGLAGVIGIIAGTTTEFVDLAYWGGWTIFLAVLSYFGYKGKRKQQAKEAERERIAQEALAANQQMAAQMAVMQQQFAAQQQRDSTWPAQPPGQQRG